MSRAIFGCRNFGGRWDGQKAVTDIEWVEIRDGAKYPTMHSNPSPQTKDYLAQNTLSAKTEQLRNIITDQKGLVI